MGKIVHNNGIPLYYQLKVLFRDKINKGEWHYDEQIPNEFELAKTYEVSRATIRQAIMELVSEGLLYRKRGKGTFVAKPKIEGDFIKFYFPNEFGGKHEVVEVKQLACPAEIAEALELTTQDEVYYLIRTRYCDQEPVVLEKSYIPKELAPNLFRENLEYRLYDLLSKQYGIRVSSAKTYVDPVLLTDREAELLRVDKKLPALKLTRIAYTNGNKPVGYSISIMRGDRCRLLIRSEDT